MDTCTATRPEGDSFARQEARRVAPPFKNTVNWPIANKGGLIVVTE